MLRLPKKRDPAPATRKAASNSGKDSMNFLHTMIRVKDQEKSIDFYTNKLGMKLIRSKDYPDGKFTNTFVGYDDSDPNAPMLELTCNWDQETPYETVIEQ